MMTWPSHTLGSPLVSPAQELCSGVGMVTVLLTSPSSHPPSVSMGRSRSSGEPGREVDSLRTITSGWGAGSDWDFLAASIAAVALLI